MPKAHPLAGAVLVFCGAWAIILAAFWNLLNLEDQGPQCLGGCGPSATQYYWTVYEVSTLIAVAGLASAIIGARLLLRAMSQRISK